MAPVIGAPAGTYFTLRLYKRLTTNPALSWANTYEFVANSTVDSGMVSDLVTRVFTFEQDMHLTDVQFDRAILSTWIEDGQPYDPTSFITQPLTGLGTRLAGGEALSLNYCLFIRRQPDYGQNGKLFLRRCLTEEDVYSPSGAPGLVSQATINAALQAALTISQLDGYLGNGEEWGMRMKSVLLIDRPVNALIAAGARVIQYNNRYFDVP